jgi:hypothetical protein
VTYEDLDKAVEEMRMICARWGLDFDDPDDRMLVIRKICAVAFSLSESEGPPTNKSGEQK